MICDRSLVQSTFILRRRGQKRIGLSNGRRGVNRDTAFICSSHVKTAVSYSLCRLDFFPPAVVDCGSTPLARVGHNLNQPLYEYCSSAMRNCRNESLNGIGDP